MAEIFLLEDDRILNKGISIALEKDGHAVTPAYGFCEAEGLLNAREYDLFILDINLPDGNGMEFCKMIRFSFETPVLFLTANDAEEDMIAGFDAGCDDYVSKPFSVAVLRRKIHAMLKRSGRRESNVFRYRQLRIDRDKHLVTMAGEEIHLTTTEYRLLEYLACNKGRIVTKGMLLEHIWDIDGSFVDDNTVRVNITRLRKKLGDEEQEYIATVFGMGYTLGE